MAGKTLAVARLWLEVNSFSPLPTGSAEFERCEWNSGPDALAKYAGTPTEMGAVHDFAAGNPDWQVTALRSASAPPGGPMEDTLFEAFRDEVYEGLEGGGWDAVYLSLHGATATPTQPDPETELVAGIRDVVGDVPLGASFDMHANLGQPLVDRLDVLAGYKTLPHVDMAETAERVLAMLTAMAAADLRPARALARPGYILPSFNMRTTDGPMKEIEDLARALETGPILDVSPFGGFPYADGPFTGASVAVTADGDEAAAKRAADRLAEAMGQRAPRFAVELPDAALGLRRALAQEGGTVAVLESADNTYSGGIGDTPGLFRALIDAKTDMPAVFAYFCDPELVARAHAAGPGGTLRCKLGASVTEDFGPAVAVEATVSRLTDGIFTNIGPMETGVGVTMGRSAVLRVGTVDVIVTESRQPVNDPAYFEIHGIDLTGVRLLCVKAKNHFRAGLGPFCRAFVEVDTPGPAAIDLTSLPYRHADTKGIV